MYSVWVCWSLSTVSGIVRVVGCRNVCLEKLYKVVNCLQHPAHGRYTKTAHTGYCSHEDVCSCTEQADLMFEWLLIISQPHMSALPPLSHCNHHTPCLYAACDLQPLGVRGRAEGVPGERRIRRTIFYRTATGGVVKRTIVITGREDIAALNVLYKRAEGFGEQVIPSKPCR